MLFTKTNALKIYPNTPVPIIVESSNNGFLWIYEMINNENPQFIFPKKNKGNTIEAGVEYILPRRNVEFIKSGNSVGKRKTYCS